MGSPVIIRPICKNGSWHPGFVFLKKDTVEALKGKENRIFATGDTMRDTPVAVLRNKAIPATILGINESSDVIVALQQYVEKNGYQKIGGAK